MGQLKPIEPFRIMCIDGVEREFLTSMGAIKRLAKKKRELERDESLSTEEKNFEIGITALFESLLNKGDLTQEQFENVIPANMDVVLLMQKVGELSNPERPSMAAPLHYVNGVASETEVIAADQPTAN